MLTERDRALAAGDLKPGTCTIVELKAIPALIAELSDLAERAAADIGFLEERSVPWLVRLGEYTTLEMVVARLEAL